MLKKISIVTVITIIILIIIELFSWVSFNLFSSTNTNFLYSKKKNHDKQCANFIFDRMKALGRKSRMRYITHNPSGELVKSITFFLKKLKK